MMEKAVRTGREMTRGQAALFDGIMFLLFASFSVAMIYVFVNDYGKAQDEALRSGYILAYVQQAGKVIFFTQVKTLKDVANPVGLPNAGLEGCWKDPEFPYAAASCIPGTVARGYPYSDLADPLKGCASLSKFDLSTVSDLLKKDLGDGTDESFSCLDDQFGNPSSQSPGTTQFCTVHDNAGWRDIPRVPGKMALRCVMKELMKPLQTAGFKYFADFEREQSAGSSIPQKIFNINDPDSFRITNHWEADEGNWYSCDNVTSKTPPSLEYPFGGGGIDNVLSTSLPFRVNKGNTLDETMNFVLRVCIWSTKVSNR
jgi:hypothetical protein